MHWRTFVAPVDFESDLEMVATKVTTLKKGLPFEIPNANGEVLCKQEVLKIPNVTIEYINVNTSLTYLLINIMNHEPHKQLKGQLLLCETKTRI